MATVNTLIEQVRDYLKAQDAEPERDKVYSHFISECRTLNLTEEDFYRDVLRYASRGIDWAAIEAKKQDQAEEQKRIEEEKIKKQKLIEQNLAVTNQKINQILEEKVVEGHELKKIFQKAKELSMDMHVTLMRVYSTLQGKNYTPYPKVDINLEGLEERLTSTNWYSPDEYAKIKPKEPPNVPPGKKETKKGVLFLIFFIIAAVVAVVLVLNNNRESSSSMEAQSADSAQAEQPSSTTIYQPDTTKIKTYDTKVDSAAKMPTTESDNAPDEAEKNALKGVLERFFGYENESDISAALNCYEFPVEYYPSKNKKVLFGREKLDKVYTSIYGKQDFHRTVLEKIIPKKTDYGFEVNVMGRFDFIEKKYPDSMQSRPVNDFYHFNKDYKIIYVDVQ